ncbi:hypothetical protein NE237_013135 [Protea cynaroides]|uniref:Uncharacterized protein n=1 Tax=Protea cynaroides TaxID=273540 RepID=A0A9Q0H2D2_9MAGN|nr:hypothetical protein NE237_013135 [Protea cynaroides]
MPEKGATSVCSPVVFRPSSCFPLRFPVLTMAVFLGMLFIWSIDASSIKNSIKAWRNRRDYLALKLQSPDDLTHYTFHSRVNVTEYHQNLTQSSNHGHVNLTHHNSSFSSVNITRSEQVSFRNANSSTHRHHWSSNRAPRMPHLGWISVKLEPNFTANLLSRWLAPGGEPCRDSVTEDIRIPGLDDRNPVTLSAGDIHKFVIHTVDGTGNPRCLGGDYFETDLSGELCKSRPPLKDHGNGSYSISLQVHPDFSGDYNLTVVLLFRHFEGLKFSPQRFVFQRELRRIPIRFFKSNAQLPELRICKKSDFAKDVWSGRWTRLAKNDDCEISNDGRYRCLNPNYPCQKPWCEGSLSSLESNGWVYSSHCSFRLFSAELAWECLQNRWIFFWGDSNHVDTIRNLLNFILELPEIKTVPRRFDMNFTNPRNKSQMVRMTSIFNGHWNETQNYQGLDSLRDEGFRNLVKQYFISEDRVPDTVILNSGLHDGVHFMNVRQFSVGAEQAARFWKELLEGVRERGKLVPEVLYRSTIATGGYARRLTFNPSKMEVFNGVLLEKMKREGIVSGVIDDFDITYAWHYDNRCNDGVHYGRAPLKAKWRDGEIGHQYFVDLMLGHVILNALCTTT